MVDRGADASVGEAGPSRQVGLNAVRFAAAMMVFATHVPGRVGFPDFSLPFGPWGGNGVSVFFVLSGYLLWRPFVTGKPSLRDYMLSRAGRILPAYWLAVLVLVPIRGGDILSFLVMQPNVTPNPLGILWTLVAEVQFYVMVPLLALFGRPLLAPLVLGLASFGLELTVAQTALHGSAVESLIPVRFWAFAPGMILAVVQPKTNRFWLAGGLTLLAAGAWALPYMPGAGGGQHTNWLATIGAGLLVGWGINAAPVGRTFWAAGAAISYGIYLWHVDLVDLLGWAGVPLTFVVASLSYVLLERRVMEWVSRRRDHRRVLRAPGVPSRPRAIEWEQEAAAGGVAVGPRPVEVRSLPLE